MTFEEVIEVVNQLSEKERQQLYDYLSHKNLAHPRSPEERIQRMDAAATIIRNGLSSSELKEMTVAMNEKYIEPRG
ncbi:MAG: hypothetical protein Q9P01_03610 [Anaerolineae bacterium]|nr:hypothetical protein [Anaerolineae bacterium]